MYEVLTPSQDDEPLGDLNQTITQVNFGMLKGLYLLLRRPNANILVTKLYSMMTELGEESLDLWFSYVIFNKTQDKSFTLDIFNQAGLSTPQQADVWNDFEAGWQSYPIAD